MLVSNDGDFVEQVGDLLDAVGGSGCSASASSASAFAAAVERRGWRSLDLENDVHAFNVRLPRVRIIPIDEFDPADFL